MSTAIAAADFPEEMARIADLLAQGPYTPFLEGTAKPIARQAIRDNFTSSATPDNANWPPRKIAGDGHPLLMESGAMLQAATGGGAGAIAEAGTHDLTLGVDGGTVPYAAAQNYGYAPRNLPAREYLGMDDESIDACAEELADFCLPLFTEGSF
jgi:phage gpG-like protein